MWITANEISINLDNITCIRKITKEDVNYIIMYTQNGYLEIDFQDGESRNKTYKMIREIIKNIQPYSGPGFFYFLCNYSKKLSLFFKRE